MSDDIDRLLKEMGAASRGRSSALPGAPTPECLEESAFEALVSGQMAEDRRLEAERHVAACVRCTRVMALIAAESRPLADARRDAVLRLAKAELQPQTAPQTAAAMIPTPPVRKSTPLLARIQDWLGGVRRWQAGLAVGMAAAVALFLLVPRAGQPPREGSALPFDFNLSLSGGQQVYQGTEQSSSQSGPLVFGPDSRVKALLAPEGGASGGGGTAGESSPGESTAQEVLLLIARADGSIFQAAPGDATRVTTGPGGILVQGDGQALFGDVPGPVSLYFVVAPRGQLPGADLLGKPADQVAGKLEDGAREKKWWLDVRKATYAK